MHPASQVAVSPSEDPPQPVMGPGLMLAGRERSLTRVKPTLICKRVLLQLWAGSGHHGALQQHPPCLRCCIPLRRPPPACDGSGDRADGAGTESHAGQTKFDMQKSPAAALRRLCTPPAPAAAGPLPLRCCIPLRRPPPACDGSGTRAGGAGTESHAGQTNTDMQKSPAAALGRVCTPLGPAAACTLPHKFLSTPPMSPLSL